MRAGLDDTDKEPSTYFFSSGLQAKNHGVVVALAQGDPERMRGGGALHEMPNLKLGSKRREHDVDWATGSTRTRDKCDTPQHAHEANAACFFVSFESARACHSVCDIIGSHKRPVHYFIRRKRSAANARKSSQTQENAPQKQQPQESGQATAYHCVLCGASDMYHVHLGSILVVTLVRLRWFTYAHCSFRERSWPISCERGAGGKPLKVNNALRKGQGGKETGNHAKQELALRG